MSKRYYWLKLEKSFFDDKLTKKLRKLAGGDTYCIIYLRLILLSMETDGTLYFDGIEGSFSEELALTLDESPENVQALLSILFASNRITQVSDDEIEMLDFKSMTGSESSSAVRVRKHRNKNKNDILISENADKTLQCNTHVTPSNSNVKKCNTEKEKEKEKDLDIDKNKNIYCQLVVDDFNLYCPSLPKVVKLTPKRIKAIATVRKTYSEQEIQQAFCMAEQSDFLTNRTGKGFSAGFDWLMNVTNMTKVLEGNYENKHEVSSMDKAILNFMVASEEELNNFRL